VSEAGVTRPAAPRDAASLVLVRRGQAGPEVLLGRRARGHRFLPNVYAFPGGRVDLSDRSEIPLKPLNIQNKENMQPLAVAAVRETWEETGILLGALSEDGRLRADLSGLRYLCRAITPAESPIRFHARFFLQDVTGLPLGLAGSGELLDLGFRPLAAALQLPLADITEFVLRLVGQLGPDLTPERAAFWRYRRGKPMIRWDIP
jgi:8-oxo-dGTP pyrophosphatase MutT (NUDIX family)